MDSPIEQYIKNIPPGSKCLIIGYVAIYILTLLMPSEVLWKVLYFCQLTPYISPSFHISGVLFYSFFELHLVGLLFTVLILALTAPHLEWVMGTGRFIFFYLSCAIGGAVLQQGILALLASRSGIAAHEIATLAYLGPRAAVVACLVAYGVIFAKREIHMLFPPISLSGWQFALICLVLELYSALRSDLSVYYITLPLAAVAVGITIIALWRQNGTLGHYQ